MPNLPLFSLRYKALVLATAAVLLGWGIITFQTVPRLENPKQRKFWGAIVTTWPGATAEDVENLVTDPIEEAIGTLVEVERIVSRSTVGLSSMRVTLAPSIKDSDAAWDKVRAKIAHAKLPVGAGTPYVNSEFSGASAMVLALYQQLPEGREELRYSPRQLEIYAKEIKERIELIPAVAKVELYGVRSEVVYLEAQSGTWSQLGLTVDELQNLLQQRNIVAPGGSIDTLHSRFNVKPTGEFNAVDEINQVVVDASPATRPGQAAPRDFGSPTYLKDLGIQVVRAYEDPPSVLTRLNLPHVSQANPCIIISFTMKDDYNIVDLGHEARQAVKEIQAAMLPADLQLAVAADQAAVVTEKIDTFISNLWQAMLLVIGIAYLLVGLRAALVMASSIPLVMISSIGVSSLFNVDIETTSLAALVIALGMLVDCGIEVADNVHHHLQMGFSRFDATVQGVQQIAFPVLIGSMTTVAAFLPMLTIPGAVGDAIYSLPVVVSVTLCLSWFLAMTVIALMAYWLIRPATVRPPLIWLGDKLSNLLRRGKKVDPEESGIYVTLARFCVRHKLTTIGLAMALAMICFSLLFTGRVGTKFFPVASRDQFVIDVRLPEGTPFARTNQVCLDVEEMLRKLAHDGTPEGRLRNSVTYVGQGGPRFYPNIDPDDPSSSYAQIVVNTMTAEQVEQYVRDIRACAREGNAALGIAAIPDARIVAAMLDMGPRVDSPVGIRVFGDDVDTLKHYAEQLKQVLRKTPGTVDVYDSWGNPGYQLTVHINAERANVAGVSNYSIARTLNAYYAGHPLTIFREGDHQVPVRLRLPASERTALPDPGRIFVEGSRGKVPLESVATITEDWKPTVIGRYNSGRMMEVRSRVDEDLLPNSVLADVLPQVRKIEAQLPPGYRIEIGGEYEETLKGQKSTSKSTLISMGLILLLLVLEFNSFAKPMMILAMLPLAIAASVLGMYVTRQPLGFMAGLGIMSLIGIVINDGITLLEFADIKVKEKLERGEGLAQPGEKSCGGLTVAAFRDCMVRAGRLRLMPITLTTVTTVAGLMPLVFSGGPLFQPLAIVLVSGLALGVLAMLFVLPALYTGYVELFGVNMFPDKQEPAPAPAVVHAPALREPVSNLEATR